MSVPLPPSGRDFLAYQRLVVDAYAGEERIIRLAGARHNDPVEGTALADFHRALDWLLPSIAPNP